MEVKADMFKYKIIIFICVGLVITSNLFAQKNSFAKETPSDCEYVRHALDESLIRTSKNENSNVIFIFRLGKDENSKKILAQRVKTVKSHLKFRVPNFNRFVIAEGEKNSGLGKLEIYVEGRLVWELYAKKNLDIGYNCLEEPY